MGSTAGNNKETKGQEDPAKRNVTPRLENQVGQGKGNEEIGDSYERVRNHVGPNQCRTTQVAIEMREEIRGQQKPGEGRPDYEWADDQDRTGGDEPKLPLLSA